MAIKMHRASSKYKTLVPTLLAIGELLKSNTNNALPKYTNYYVRAVTSSTAHDLHITSHATHHLDTTSSTTYEINTILLYANTYSNTNVLTIANYTTVECDINSLNTELHMNSLTENYNNTGKRLT